MKTLRFIGLQHGMNGKVLPLFNTPEGDTLGFKTCIQRFGDFKISNMDAWQIALDTHPKQIAESLLYNETTANV